MHEKGRSQQTLEISCTCSRAAGVAALASTRLEAIWCAAAKRNQHIYSAFTPRMSKWWLQSYTSNAVTAQACTAIAAIIMVGD